MNFGPDTSGKAFWQEAVWREERCQALNREPGDYRGYAPPALRSRRYARGDPHVKNNVSRGVNGCMEAAAAAAALDFAAEDAHALGALRSRCSTPFAPPCGTPSPPDSPRRQQMPSLAAGYFTGFEDLRPGGKAGCGNIKNDSEEVGYCLSPPPKMKARPYQSSRSPGRAMYELGSSKKEKGIKQALRGAWASARAIAKRAQPRKRRSNKGMAFAEFADIGVPSSGNVYACHGAKVRSRLAPGGAPRSAWSGRTMNRTGVDDGCFGPALMLSDTHS